MRGQSHADARAMLPSLAGVPADRAEERAALVALADWCRRWSPQVALDAGADGTGDGLEGLLIDVTGVAHLFGGEEKLVADIYRRLGKAEIPARIALADTAGAAWAIARYGRDEARVIAPGGQRAALAALPVAALRVNAATVAMARRLGLVRIGNLVAMPRAGLARRFRGGGSKGGGSKGGGQGDGIALVRRLDQALGIEPEPLVPLDPPPRHIVRAVFAEPLLNADQVANSLNHLSPLLARQLEEAEQGARALTLAAYRTDGRVVGLDVRLGRPQRTPGVWRRLFAEAGLGRIDPGFGIDALTLAAGIVEPLSAIQAALDGEAEAGAERLSALIDRLVARLGTRAIRAARPRASWWPERAARFVPAQDAPAIAADADPGRARPLLLLDPPEPVEAVVYGLPEGPPQRFTWRRVARRVARAEGPERIEPEWWREKRGRALRDYWRVEDEEGVRYWLYREGLYGRAAPDEAAPSWWMHGLFG